MPVAPSEGIQCCLCCKVSPERLRDLVIAIGVLHITASVVLAIVYGVCSHSGTNREFQRNCLCYLLKVDFYAISDKYFAILKPRNPLIDFTKLHVEFVKRWIFMLYNGEMSNQVGFSYSSVSGLRCVSHIRRRLRRQDRFRQPLPADSGAMQCPVE